MIISVVGMGKIGLPLAVQYASHDYRVIGIDVDETTVQSVNAGVAPFPGEHGLDELLSQVQGAGQLTATTSYELAIPQSNVVVVAVPLFVHENGLPDFRIMDSATKSIGKNLAKKTLVIYETTLPIGTTRARLKPALEHHSGLREGKDFHVVFSPERVLTGRVFEDLRKYPKLVGGLTKIGSDLALDFYHSVLDFDERTDLARPNGAWDLGSAEAAEMAKLAETTYRDVNIALANQFATFAERIGVDVHEVIAASNSQPFSKIHDPGISVGGHCIPVYPRLYLSTDPDAELVRVARDLNSSMIKWAISAVNDELGESEKAVVLVLGVSYRSGVKEIFGSGAIALLSELRRLGHKVIAQDPLYSREDLEALGFDSDYSLQDATVLIAHNSDSEFSLLEKRSFPNIKLVLDGRRALNEANWNSVPFRRLGVGNPSRLLGAEAPPVE